MKKYFVTEFTTLSSIMFGGTANLPATEEQKRAVVQAKTELSSDVLFCGTKELYKELKSEHHKLGQDTEIIVSPEIAYAKEWFVQNFPEAEVWVYRGT